LIKRSNNLHILTHENSDKFNLYLRDIAKFRPLKRQQESDIIIRVKKGDKAAMRKLVESNLRFVVSVAANYRNQGVPLSDLVNEGNIGLIRALKRFDESKGYKFISYAVWWIRQAILQAMSEQSRIVRMPLNRVSTIFRVGKIIDKLEQKLKRYPSREEIAQKLKLEEKEVNEAFTVAALHRSFDTPIDEGGENLLDLVPDEQAREPDAEVDVHFLNIKVNEILSTLRTREADILRLSFGIDCEKSYTLEEIAIKYGLTRERIRQIKEKAIKRLKHPSRNSMLKMFYKD
jgi:RNA polymerase primary sigma factor